MGSDYHEDTAALIERMCRNVEREDFTLNKGAAAEALLKTYNLFDLPRPKHVVWCTDLTNKQFVDSARSARSAGSAGSARSAWSAWSAWSARSARSAGSAGSARSARSAWFTALDDDFGWFVVEYEYCKNPDADRPPNENDYKYLEYSELLMQAMEAGAGYRVEWEDTLYIVPTPLVKIDEQNRFHSETGPAIRWKGGAEDYLLHGENFDKPLWKRVVSGKMTAKEVMSINDTDQRTIALSMLGVEEMHKHLGGELIHTGIRGTKLYRVDDFEDTGETEYYTLKTDASTPRQFIEFVPPEVGAKGDADVAEAWMYDVPLEDYLSVERHG